MSRGKAAVALTLGLVAVQAQACTCPAEPAPAAAYRRADAVLLAEVLRVEGDAAKGAATATLRVQRSWKSAYGGELTLVTRTTCAYVFVPGSTLLVYAYRDKRHQRLETRRCMGNQPVAQAAAALAWLDANAKPPAQAASR